MIRTANLVGSISRNAGGLHESVRRLVQCASEKGVGVRVLTIEDEFTQEDLAVWSPVAVEVFRARWPTWFGFAPDMIDSLKEYRPDLVHSHGIWMYPSIATTTYCVRRYVPYMISPHGMLDPWAVRHHRWKKVLAYAVYESNHVKGARCIRALCESEARAIGQMKLKNPVAVIPNGIDLPPERKQEAKDGGMVAAEGMRKTTSRNQKRGMNAPWKGLVDTGQKVLLFLSRIHPKKGLVNLLKAWSAGVATQKTEWVLAIAGWDQGEHEVELKSLATELGIHWHDVREPLNNQSSTGSGVSLLFLGPQFGEAKAACYAECDAFVLPSFSEGLPMVILEAWAYGKAVLMTPECNLPEGLAAQAALSIDTSVNGIAEGLRQLLTCSERERTEMGRRGRQLVRERFTWDAIADQLKVTYEWMMGDGPAPNCIFQK